MPRYIDANLIEYHDSFTNDGEYARVAFGDDIDVLPTADVVSKEKYDELNERYHRLLENAKILADAVREYERREDG